MLNLKRKLCVSSLLSLSCLWRRPSRNPCMGLLIAFSISVSSLAAVQWPESTEPFHIDAPIQYAKYLAFGAGSLWLSDPESGSIWRLSPVTGAVQGSIASTYSGGIAYDGQYLWKAAYSSPVIRCIRTTDGSTVREIPGVGTQQAGLAWDGSNLWIANQSTQRIYQLNPSTGAQLTSFDSPGPEPRDLTWWNGYLYHCDSHEDRIYQIDPSNGAVVSSIATPMRSGSPRGLTTDGTYLWYSDWSEGIDRLIIDVSPDSRTIRSNPILMLAEMTYEMTNTGASTIESHNVYWAVPMADAEHTLLDVTFDPDPSSYVVDAFGQTIAHFASLDPVPPSGTARIRCHAFEMIWRIDYQIDPSQVMPLSSIPQGVQDLYLVDADFLHITHSEIVATAETAVGEETNPFLMAVRLHDHVADRMTYGSYATPYDALDILQSPFGGCDHYTILYMALGRAVGLPTRKVKAFYYYENEDNALSHVWPEVYIPGYGWIPFDPTRDDRSPIRHRYIGCEPLGTVYFRNGGTDETYTGQSGRSWRTGGAPRTTSTAFWGAAPLVATECAAVPGSTFGSIEIDWRNPPAVDLTRVLVRRADESYPASREDGDSIYDSDSPTPDAAVSVTDTGLTPSVAYYYAVFSQSATGLWSRRTLEGQNGNHSSPAATGTAAVFSVSIEGHVYSDATVHAASFSTDSADVAEWVTVSEQVEAGDVLALDVDHPLSYCRTSTVCSLGVAGVVSSEPGVTLGGTCASEAQALLALVGVVPVKVTDEGGPIQPGDLLVSSSTPGHAMRWAGPDPCPCTLVGKALEPMSDEMGVILVLLTAH